MPDIGINIVDFVAVCAVAYAGRSGYHLGFAESVWSTLRWGLILAAGTLAWAPLGQEIGGYSGFSFGISAVLAYLVVGTVTWLVVDQLRRLFANRLLLAIPAGPIDGFFGSLAGMATVASAVLVFYAILSPFETGPIDWNPIGLKTENSISELGRALFGTVRQAVFDDSLLGRTLQEHLRMLLIPPAAA